MKLQFRADAYNFLNHPLWSFNGTTNLLWASMGPARSIRQRSVQPPRSKAGASFNWRSSSTFDRYEW
jgi:hypothetical protein